MFLKKNSCVITQYFSEAIAKDEKLKLTKVRE